MQIVGVQLDIAWENKPANHRRVRSMLAGRVAAGSLIVLPEMFSTGFSMNVAAVSDTWSMEDQAFVSSLAREHGSFVLAGVVATTPGGKGLNQAVVVDQTGVEVGRYTKMHPFSPGKEAEYYAKGENPMVVKVGEFRVCPAICYDLRFPEMFRVGVRRGADLFVVLANWPEARGEHWTTLLKARAIENQAYVVGVNRCGKDPWLGYPGLSTVIDPKGKVVVEMGKEEGLMHAIVNADEVRRWRAEFPALGDMRE